ncbi:thyrotroph embryonic factor-like [Littorina saxatilis]|uniref:BZIP domain-containing protein n=1 Tax=Littorina saxatilis TaxID=31220 RepID=A0AAN9B2C7_9CAEN
MALNSTNFGGMTLKALLENPDLQHAPAVLSGAPSSKGKKAVGGSGDIDFTSAFLGPQLWDKTYDGSDFNLEYMDLDEFLSENGIPVVETPGLDELVSSNRPSPQHSPVCERSSSPRVTTPHSPRMPLSPPIAHMMAVPPITVSSHNQFLVKPKVEKAEEVVQKLADSRATSPSAVSTGSTPPVSPLPVQVEFKLTEQDIALSSIPGQDMFDPTQHTFNDDELKPQPMIKKSKKIFVPEESKDDKYWARRRKNNYAAKRSRDARRIKENQIAMRASYLEAENSTLRSEMEKLRRDNTRLKHRLNKYESPNSSS